jgi:hypothetical protein
MKTPYAKLTIVLSILIFASLGCAPVVLPTVTPVPTAQGPITLDPSVPLGQQVEVSAINFQETGEGPNFTITASIPAIVGVDEPRVKAFNDLNYSIFQLFVDELKNSLVEMPVDPITKGSSLDIQYTLVSPPGDIISIRYLITGYADGAIDSFHNTYTLNFNIETGRVVEIEKLFLSGTNYLQILSDYCRTELSSRNISPEISAFGVEPTVENYQRWNIAADGLMITFDESQISTTASGPQSVIVPYDKLKGVIDPQGVLGKFIQ